MEVVGWWQCLDAMMNREAWQKPKAQGRDGFGLADFT